MNGLNKLFDMNNMKKNWVTYALALLVIVCVMKQMGMNPMGNMMEGFGEEKSAAAQAVAPKIQEPGAGNVVPNDDEELEYGKIGEKQEVNLPSCSQFVSSNLLPKDDPKLDSSFTEFSPAKSLEGQSFIDTNKYAVGMQSQSLRNANHQLRSDPPISNTMECASPWNNTTITSADQRQMNIGA